MRVTIVGVRGFCLKSLRINRLRRILRSRPRRGGLNLARPFKSVDILDLLQPYLRDTRHGSRLFSPRSGRQHKAWGVSPRIAVSQRSGSPRSGRQPQHLSANGCADMTAVARSAGSVRFAVVYLGFRFASPQALCCRLLRRLLQKSAPKAKYRSNWVFTFGA